MEEREKKELTRLEEGGGVFIPLPKEMAVEAFFTHTVSPALLGPRLAWNLGDKTTCKEASLGPGLGRLASFRGRPSARDGQH